MSLDPASSTARGSPPPRPAALSSEWVAAALFLAPALVIYLTIIVYPLVYSVWLSFFDWDGIRPDKRFVGFDNYVTLWSGNRVFWIALKNNALWTAVALVVPTALGLGLALLLNGPIAGRGLLRGVFYFPAILSLSICGLIWTWIYHPTLGFLNQFLGWVGLESLQRAWLSEPSIALFAVMVAAAWHNTGLPMLLYLAGLQTIPKEIQEAAAVDGATKLQRFRFVIWPMLKETTFVVLAITFINSLKVYDVVYVMTYGGPANQIQVLGTWMYFLTYNFNRIGLGTAIAVVLFGLTLIFAIPYTRKLGRDG